MLKAWRAYTLERELGWFEVFLWVVANPVASGLVIFSVQALGTPGYYGGSLPAAFAIAGLLYFPIAVCFMLASASVQRPAAPYVLISRVLSPPVGYLALWFYLAASGMLSLGLLAYLGLRSLGSSLLLAGLAFGDPVAERAGMILQEPLVELLLGFLVLLSLWLLAGLRLRRVRCVLHAVVAGPLIATALLAANALLTPAEVAASNFRAALGLDPSQVIQMAASGVPKPLAPADFWSATFSMLLVAVWAFAGIESASFMAGEVKDPPRSYARGYAAGFSAVLLLYVLLPWVAAARLGTEFVASYSYLYYNYRGLLESAAAKHALFAPDLFSLLALFSRWEWVAVAAGLTSFLWFYNTAYTIWLSATRALFALAHDRLAPSSLARVTGMRGIPVAANNAIFAVGVVGALLGYGITVGALPAFGVLRLLNFSFAMIVWLTGLSLALLNISPGRLGGKALPVSGWLSAGAGGSCFAAGWAMLLLAGVSASPAEVAAAAVVGVLGFAFMLATMAYMRGRGVDHSKVAEELP